MIIDRGPDRALMCASMGLETATTPTTDEDYDQDYEEEIQRPTKITIKITTKMVHRQQVVDPGALSAYARRPNGRVGRLRRLIAAAHPAGV